QKLDLPCFLLGLCDQLITGYKRGPADVLAALRGPHNRQSCFYCGTLHGERFTAARSTVSAHGRRAECRKDVSDTILHVSGDLCLFTLRVPHTRHGIFGIVEYLPVAPGGFVALFDQIDELGEVFIAWIYQIEPVTDLVLSVVGIRSKNGKLPV